MKQHSLDMLANLRIGIFHDRCPDGLSSALILKEAMPSLDVRFMQYGTEEHRALTPEPGMIFCDFTPVRENADAFIAAGAIVLDHHEEQEDIVARFGERGVYAHNKVSDPGVSGAVLAFELVWKPLDEAKLERKTYCPSSPWQNTIERFARLAGVRDTWQNDSPDWLEAWAQAEVLMLYPVARWMEETPVFATLEERMRIGRMLIEKRVEKDRRAIAEGHVFTSSLGKRVLVVGTTETSDLAEQVRTSSAAGGDADVVIGFRYRLDAGRAKIVLSCRSVTEDDILPFARFVGGGGHARAAGAAMFLKEDDGQPYKLIETLYNRYERSKEERA